MSLAADVNLEAIASAEDVLQILQSLPAAIYTCDMEGRIQFYNQAAADLWGRAPVIGKDLWCGSWRIYHPDGTPMPLSACPMAIAIRERKPVLGQEIIVERPDGNRRCVLPYPRPLLNSAGQPTGAVNMLVDITERRRSDDARDRLAAIVDSSEDAIISKNLDGVIQTWNAAAERLFGYTADEAVGQSILMLIPPDRVHEEMRIQEKLHRGEQVDHFETVRRRKDGSLVDLSLTISPIRDPSGRITGGSKIARDITAAKQIERERAALLVRERLARDEVQALHEVALAVAGELDLSSLVQTITDSATRLIGAQFGSFFYNVLDERGESYQLFTLTGAPREAFEKFGQPRNTAVFGPTFRGEAPIRSDDIQKDPRYGRSPPYYGQPRGHLPVHSYLAAPVVSRTGKVHGGLFFGHERIGVFTEQHERLIVGISAQAAIAIDNAQLFQQAQSEIAERTRAESAMVEALDAAEAANRAKDRFLAVLSHELRTPLAPVGMAVAALESDPELPFRLRDDLAMIRRNVDLEARLIDDLLDISRVTNGKMQLRLETVRLHEILNQVLQSCQRDFAEKRLNVPVHLDASDDRVVADPARLQQVVWNILRNAVKFTPAGRDITVKTWQETAADGSCTIAFQISDTGEGIDPELLPRIFDAFEQGNLRGTQHGGQRFGGLGLGLAIARAVVERHGGTIDASSEGPGRGATFTVRLKGIARGAGATKSGQPFSEDEEKAPVNARILLVEDHLDSAQMLARLLKSGGYAVSSATTVAQALELASSDAFDVLVSDIGLPDGTGYDLMRQLGGKLKGIALSGYGMEEDVQKSKAAGFAEHMVKPISAAALQVAIERLVGRATA